MFSEIDYMLIDQRLKDMEKQLEEIESQLKVLNAYVDTSLTNKYYRTVTNTTSCYFDNPEYKNKVMSVSCPCKHCSPYSLSSGSFVDAGLTQRWRKREVSLLTNNIDVEE